VIVEKKEREKVSHMGEKKKCKEKLIYLCSLFQQHQLRKDMSIICGWLCNPVPATKQKRQVFCIGICDSEMRMERCRLN